MLDRDVAFALINTEGDEASRTRIVREAQAMGRLSAHPNIVTVYDLGEHDGQPFLVTELMATGDLESLIDRSPNRRIPLFQVIDITRSVCLGLEFAHSHGIVHRDLKPGNVWLALDGTPKIGDFGLAVSSDNPRLTLEGMMVGTLYYMPPEQASGRNVTAQSDLYSLGAMLYELVTGTPPFTGKDPVTIIGQHVNNVPVSPTWHNPSCPQALEDLILRLLEKSPSKRPNSATEVLIALDAISGSVKTEDTTAIDPRSSLEQVALTVTKERPDLTARAAPDGTLTILFSDIEGSSTMTERLGDQMAQEVLRTHSAITRGEVESHGGFEVKSLGDGFMLAFSSGRRGLQCAMALQRSFAAYSGEHPEYPVRVRIGLHAGEVVREADDFFGRNVILASRIADQANGGQILVSSLLKELTESAGDLEFGTGHDVKLKGLTGTTRIYPVIWDQTGFIDSGVIEVGQRPGLKGLVLRAGRSRLGKAAIGLAVAAGVAAGVLVSGIVSGPTAAPRADSPIAAGLVPSNPVTLDPNSSSSLVFGEGDVTVTVPAGSVENSVELGYQELSVEDVPEPPDSYQLSSKVFDLSVSGPQDPTGRPYSFQSPITIAVSIGAEEQALAEGVQFNLVIQHFKSDQGWSVLPTEIDIQASVARAQTESLSIFALTVRRSQQAIPAPAATSTPIPVSTPTFLPITTATPTPTPTPSPTFTPVPTPTLTPVPTSTPVPTPTPTPVPQYLLETDISAEGEGRIEVVPGSDDQRYPKGTEVLVLASCEHGFTSWTGDVPDVLSLFSNPIRVTMDRQRSLVALCDLPAPTPAPAPSPTPTPTPVPTPAPGPTSTPRPFGSLERSVWFGEVFTDRVTLSLDEARVRSPDNPEWLFYGQFNFNLEALGFTVTRGLSVPTREELLPYRIIVVPAPSKLSLTEEFIDTALALVADGRSMLLWVDEGLPFYVNILTEKLGVTVYRGGVTSSSGFDDWPGGFEIRRLDLTHPITKGISRVNANQMAPVVVSESQGDANVEVVAFAPLDAEAPSALSDGPFAHTIAIGYGKGRIVIVADSSPFSDYASSDDERLGVNAIRWLARER